MKREMLIQNLTKESNDPHLAERLIALGERPYLAWWAGKLVNKSDVVGSLTAACTMLDNEVTFGQIKYAYFTYKVIPLAVLVSQESYESVRATIEERYPYPEFWDEILPYNYNHAVVLAIELLTDQGLNSADIVRKLNVSRSYAYRLRRKYIEGTIKSEEV